MDSLAIAALEQNTNTMFLMQGIMFFAFGFLATFAAGLIVLKYTFRGV